MLKNSPAWSRRGALQGGSWRCRISSPGTSSTSSPTPAGDAVIKSERARALCFTARRAVPHAGAAALRRDRARPVAAQLVGRAHARGTPKAVTEKFHGDLVKVPRTPTPEEVRGPREWKRSTSRRSSSARSSVPRWRNTRKLIQTPASRSKGVRRRQRRRAFSPAGGTVARRSTLSLARTLVVHSSVRALTGSATPRRLRFLQHRAQVLAHEIDVERQRPGPALQRGDIAGSRTFSTWAAGSSSRKMSFSRADRARWARQRQGLASACSRQQRQGLIASFNAGPRHGSDGRRGGTAGRESLRSCDVVVHTDETNNLPSRAWPTAAAHRHSIRTRLFRATFTASAVSTAGRPCHLDEQRSADPNRKHPWGPLYTASTARVAHHADDEIGLAGQSPGVARAMAPRRRAAASCRVRFQTGIRDRG